MTQRPSDPHALCKLDNVIVNFYFLISTAFDFCMLSLYASKKHPE